jgi:hypothetical protein
VWRMDDSRSGGELQVSRGLSGSKRRVSLDFAAEAQKLNWYLLGIFLLVVLITGGPLLVILMSSRH